MEQPTIAGSAGAQKITGPFELLKNSLLVYKAGFKKFAGLMLLPLLPLIFFILLEIFSPASDNLNIAIALLSFLGGAAMIYLFLIAQVGIVLILKNYSPEYGIKKAMKEANKYFWSFIMISIASIFFVLLWMLLFIIPGIVASIFYTFAVFALVFEDFRSTAALKRSKELVKGRWWAVFGRTLFLGLIFLIVSFILGIPFYFLKEGEVLYKAWDAVMQIIFFFIGPVALIFNYLMFKDLVNIKGQSKLENKKGRSPWLISIFFVLAVLLVSLPTLAIVSLDNARMSARDSRRMSDIKMVEASLEYYYGNNGSYPDDLEKLADPDFLTEIPRDPNGQPYEYQRLGDGENYELCFTLEKAKEGLKAGRNCDSKPVMENLQLFNPDEKNQD